MFREITHCRVCGNPQLLPVIDLGHQFLTGTFPKTRDQKLTCGPLELVKCDDRSDSPQSGDPNGSPNGAPTRCGLVQLRHSYCSDELYGEGYGYRSSLNASMVAHLRDTAQKLQNLVDLREGDLVLDIGSNDGTSLSFYDGVRFKRAGIDPSAERFRHFYPPGASLIVDFFSSALIEAHLHQKARLVTSIAMFYDLENPLDFMREVFEVLEDDGVWHLEQSYLPTMLSQCAYDTICHEHLEYYALKQIKWMADRAGFKIIAIELNAINGGSFALTLAKIGSHYAEECAQVEAILADESAQGLDTAAPYEKFRAQVHAHRAELKTLLSGLQARGETVFGLGASTKGNVILQFCEFGTADIPCVAEVNEDKFGAFTPGTHLPIVSETEARALRPDYFLVLPWHFRDNIVAREKAFLEAGGKLIFPLPHLEIVGQTAKTE